MKTHLLRFLQSIGLLEKVPEAPPGSQKPLARSTCFLHDGADNPRAFLLYADGYACTTHHCHKDRTFGCNLEGLIRQMVYRVTGEVMAWGPAWKYAREHEDELHNLIGDRVQHASPGGKSVSCYAPWSRASLDACLEVPSPYFLSRGYRPETLRHFGVGTCVRPLPDGRELLGWAVVPVVDRKELPPHGYTARNPKWTPGSKAIKWFHGVNRSQVLFNRVNAQGAKTLILCEGPACVMRFYEAGLRGAVATLGDSMSGAQYGIFLSLLDRDMPAVYIAADADETGRAFAEQLHQQIRGVCEPVIPKIIFPPGDAKDFGDLTADQIRGLGL